MLYDAKGVAVGVRHRSDPATAADFLGGAVPGGPYLHGPISLVGVLSPQQTTTPLPPGVPASGLQWLQDEFETDVEGLDEVGAKTSTPACHPPARWSSATR